MENREKQRVAQDENRRVQEEARKRAAEDAAKREAEEQRRALHERTQAEKNRLEDQRRQQDEHLRNQREAILRAEAERVIKMEEMHRQIQFSRQQAVAQMNEEKENRERLERLRVEVDSRQTYNNKSVVSKPTRVQAPRPPRASGNARSGATFSPQDFLDHQVLFVYSNRAAIDEKLPGVPFTKRAEGVYFLGGRKCTIEEVGGSLYVRKGQQFEPLLEWLEKTERVEGLRAKGAKSAQLFITSRQGVF